MIPVRSPRFEPEWVEVTALATASGALTSIHYDRAGRILRALESVGALRAVPFEHEVTVSIADRGAPWLTWSCSCDEQAKHDFARFGGAAENAEDHVGTDQPLRVTRPKETPGGEA